MGEIYSVNGLVPENIYYNGADADSVWQNGEMVWKKERASTVMFDGTAFSSSGWDYFGRHMQNYTGNDPFFTPGYYRNSLSARVNSISRTIAPRVYVSSTYGMSLYHSLTTDATDTGRTYYPSLMIQVEDILKNTDFHPDDPAIMVFRTYNPKRSIGWSSSVRTSFAVGVADSRYDADSTLPYGFSSNYLNYLSLSNKSGIGILSNHRNRAMYTDSGDLDLWRSSVDLCYGSKSSTTENPTISVLYNPKQGRIDMFEDEEHVHSWMESEGFNPRFAHNFTLLSDKTFHISWHHKPNGGDGSSNIYGGPYLRSFIMSLGDDVGVLVDDLGLNLPY